MYKTLIFDLDGTLVDSLQDLAYCVEKILEEDHLPKHTLDEYKMFVGNGVDKLIERALPENKKSEVKEYRKRFDILYKENCLNNTKPYPQMKEVIDKLVKKGYQLAIVTNKPKSNAVKIVNELFPDSFLYIFGNTVYQPKKPNPTLVNLAMQLMDADKNTTIYIGDSDVDLQTAWNAKLKVIGCTWGFRSRQELEEADYLCDTPLEILEVVK